MKTQSIATSMLMSIGVVLLLLWNAHLGIMFPATVAWIVAMAIIVLMALTEYHVKIL